MLAQLLINLNREGSTGKTYVIKIILRTLDKITINLSLKLPIIYYASTSVVVYLISRRTLNLVFRIPIIACSGALEPLAPAAC